MCPTGLRNPQVLRLSDTRSNKYLVPVEFRLLRISYTYFWDPDLFSVSTGFHTGVTPPRTLLVSGPGVRPPIKLHRCTYGHPGLWVDTLPGVSWDNLHDYRGTNGPTPTLLTYHSKRSDGGAVRTISSGPHTTVYPSPVLLLPPVGKTVWPTEVIFHSVKVG